MNKKFEFTDPDHPELSFSVILNPYFFKTAEEMTAPSGELGWIARVLRIVSISLVVFLPYSPR
jgi:hypothetical protein